jgi:hypothetical protein
MRAFLVLAALTLPSLAEARVDFKCESSDVSVAGWVRFGFSCSDHTVELELWNGFPPIPLVDANMESCTNTDTGVKYVSAKDLRNDESVATLELPAGAEKADQFNAKVVVSYLSVEKKKRMAHAYELKCVRH